MWVSTRKPESDVRGSGYVTARSSVTATVKCELYSNELSMRIPERHRGEVISILIYKDVQLLRDQTPRATTRLFAEVTASIFNRADRHYDPNSENKLKITEGFLKGACDLSCWGCYVTPHLHSTRPAHGTSPRSLVHLVPLPVKYITYLTYLFRSPWLCCSLISPLSYSSLSVCLPLPYSPSLLILLADMLRLQ